MQVRRTGSVSSDIETAKNGLKVEILVSGSNFKLDARGRVEVNEQLPIPENTVNEY